MPPTISIVIPTCGPATHLASVLGGLERQTVRDFEVLVVDNNVEACVSGAAIRRGSLAVSLIHEPRNGLAHARNAGLSFAKGAYIAFLDDDGVPMPDWAEHLLGGLRRFGSAAVGGTVTLRLAVEPPPWCGATERALLSELTYEGHDIPVLGEDQYIVGANMCASRQAFECVGGFSSDLGRTATSLRSSEELEFTRRLQLKGLRVSFIGSAIVHHMIDAWRLSEAYLSRRAFWQGRSDALLEARCGRPLSFGHRDWAVNFRELSRRMQEWLGERNRVLVVRRRLALAREIGYCLQSGLCRVAEVMKP